MYFKTSFKIILKLKCNNEYIKTQMHCINCRCSSISKTRNSRKNIFKMHSPGPREKINDIKIDRIDFVWKFSYARQRVDGFSRLGVLGVTRFLLTNFIWRQNFIEISTYPIEFLKSFRNNHRILFFNHRIVKRINCRV